MRLVPRQRRWATGSAISRAIVGVLATIAYAVHRRGLERSSRRTLGELNEELLCEARLLAFELNKGGDPLAVVQDPLLPTTTPERAFSDDARRRSAQDALWHRALPRLSMRPNAIRRLLGSDGGTLRTQVIGVCGMSCSGKSTVSSVLRAMAAQHGAYVPVLCLDDSYHDWMYEAPSREQPTNLVPPAGRGQRAWKNWESSRCVNWAQFVSKLRAKIAVHAGHTPFIVVEGFLLLEDAETAALVDDVICIDVGEEVAWQRRLSRALAMAARASDASGMGNYEQLSSYAVADDHARIRADAAEAVAARGVGHTYPRARDAAAHTASDLSGAAGEYDWLRLYFDEVIWPEAREVRRRVEARRAAGDVRLHVVDGEAAEPELETATRRIIAGACHELVAQLSTSTGSSEGRD